MTDDEFKAALVGISPQVLARAAGISRRAIDNITHGRVTPARKTRNRLEAWLAGNPLPQTLADLIKIEKAAFAAGMKHAGGQ